MFHFWQRDAWSIENTCTYIAETCLDCARYADPDLRDAARPFCVMTSWYAAQAQKRIDAGHPYQSDLPEWFPVGCEFHQDL